MKVSIDSANGLERTLKIAISSDKIESQIMERVEKASKTVALKGFRKGKVPVRVVQQHFGRGIRQEIVGEAINTGFSDAISQEKLNPVGQPKVEILVKLFLFELHDVWLFNVFALNRGFSHGYFRRLTKF